MSEFEGDLDVGQDANKHVLRENLAKEEWVEPPDQCWQCDCNDGNFRVYTSPPQCSCGRFNEVQCP